MELYFSPLACSLATRIALYEAGAAATYVQVDTKAKLTQDGRDFTQLNPLALVPTLRTDDGAILTENGAILQYVADHVSGDLLRRRASRAPSSSSGSASSALSSTRVSSWRCSTRTRPPK